MGTPGRSLILTATLAGCLARGAPDPVILALGGQEARRSEFDTYVAELEARQQTALEPAVREAVLEEWLQRRVLVLEARARGLLTGGADASEERVAVERLLAGELAGRVDVSDAEVEAYYTQHAAELAQKEALTVRQILVGTANEARDVLRRLQKDPKSFEALAQTLSRGPEAFRGGLMGTFAAGELPEPLEKAAFALQPGQTSPVVQTELGHHVLRLEARTPARQPSLEEAREHIRALLGERKSALAQRDFVAGLMARAKVNHEAAKTNVRTSPS